ncbi:MAG: hypothetical protein JXK07_12075 [Spirochaetes bacterium]|nr:hypothetical protein [Spirochaetota bacterium]MBN2769437.1 hypothetical protein [Spirochaetota bacterium]
MKYIYTIPVMIITLILAHCDGGSKPVTVPEPDNIWERSLSNPVLTGNSTITDICDPSVLYTGNKYQLWASCVTNEDNMAHVCYSESIDGDNWSDPQIVFSPAIGGWDNIKTEIPTVTYNENAPTEKRYTMWYGGAASTTPDLTKIGLAYSAEGTNWTRLSADESPYSKEGLVIDLNNINVFSDPVVVVKENTYHMWFNSFSEVVSNKLEILHATSTDGITWKMDSDNPALTASQLWEYGSHIETDCDDVVHPTVIWNSDKQQFYMWYGSFDATGNETYTGIGYAVSSNGIEWTKYADNPVFTANSYLKNEETGISTGPSVVFADGVYHLYYTGADSSAKRVICHATSNGL